MNQYIREVINDVIKEVKQCTLQIKNTKFDKKFLETKLGLLMDVEKDLTKSISFQKFVSNDPEKSRLKQSREINLENRG